MKEEVYTHERAHKRFAVEGRYTENTRGNGVGVNRHGIEDKRGSICREQEGKMIHRERKEKGVYMKVRKLGSRSG